MPGVRISHHPPLPPFADQVHLLACRVCCISSPWLHLTFLVKFFFAFAPRLISAFPGAAIAVCTVQHGLIRWRFRKTRERPAGRSSDGYSEAEPPPVRSCRGLHSHLRGQRGPNAIRPLSEAWIAGGIQRRGKCLQAHLRQPIQNSGMPLVENIRWPDFLE